MNSEVFAALTDLIGKVIETLLGLRREGAPLHTMERALLQAWLHERACFQAPLRRAEGEGVMISGKGMKIGGICRGFTFFL